MLHLATCTISLYWKDLTRAGAVSGMIAGSLVVIIWIAWIKPLASVNELFGMYEIIPGFIISVMVTYFVSKLTRSQVLSLKMI